MRSSKQYPPQVGAYKVKVKNGASWQNYSTARLQISVGGEKHEGQKFISTLHWVKPRFDKIIICVNDTLQRYNYRNIGLSETNAFNESLEQGSYWIERHMDEIHTLPHFQICRWEEWKQNDEYRHAFMATASLYFKNEEFRKCLQKNVKHQYSIDYLIEEIAVFSVMSSQENAVDIYPGTLPEALKLFKRKVISGAPANIDKCHTTRIDFCRNTDKAA
jgi:hypothetical protein